MAKTTRTALVVDDETVARDFLRAILESIDWNVIGAADGQTALKTAIEQKPQLILLDVQMPGESGFTAYADLRQNPATSDIPVIMVTGIAEKTGMRFSAKAMGEYIGKEPEAYLEKPVDPEVLKSTVASVCP
jgi:CheY-like chemotaxis protein